MKVLYFHCSSGISGDMCLGAMLDLGVDPEYLLKELSLLGLEKEYEIDVRKGSRKGIAGTRVEVRLRDHGFTMYKGKHHHRTLGDIEKIIAKSSLPENIKNRSIKMFDVLADAEAQVHGIKKNEVHFHEVGATDALVDIVGTAVCLEYLGVDKVKASTVELGGGFVHCEHGQLPVPAPAVLELLKGIPVSMGRVDHETTTPTGAAILMANVDEFTDHLNLNIDKVGYGLGKRDMVIPNVLRIMLGMQKRENGSKDPERTSNMQQYIIETNIDDMNPEFYELVEERLFGAGALDVYKTPIMMKKSRPAIQLSVLAAFENVSAIENIILRETSAIGLRKFCIEKVMLPRKINTIQTKYGEVTVKTSYLNGQEIKTKPEYEDCKRIAKEMNLPLAEVYREILKSPE